MQTSALVSVFSPIEAARVRARARASEYQSRSEEGGWIPRKQKSVTFLTPAICFGDDSRSRSKFFDR